MDNAITTEVRVHWFVEPFDGDKRLDTVLRWLLACAPAACVTDAAGQTVAYAERAELALDHDWSTVRFDCGLSLRVAEPIDVPRSLFHERLDEAVEILRVVLDGRSFSVARGAAGGGTPSPAEARVFARGASRRPD